MEEFKLLAAYPLKMEKPRLRHGDVTGAYVKAPLRGRPVFMRLDKSVRPDNKTWNEMMDPVMQVMMSVYGLGSAGQNFSEFRHEKMVKWGWMEIVRRRIYAK